MDSGNPLKLVDLRDGTANLTNLEWSIGVGDQMDPGRVISLAVNHGLSQIVQISNVEFDKELKVSALMLQKPQKFLDFPVSAVLDPEHASSEKEKELQLLQIDFSSAKEKSTRLDELRTVLGQITRSSLVDEICLVADELFTNAIYNAPHPEADQEMPIERTASTRVKSARPATLRLGKSGERLVLSCQDLYGTLQPRALLKRIEDCYRQGTESMINWGPGGAGIGSFLIFNCCVGLYIATEPGKRTVVCCAFPLNHKSRRRDELPKNLHVATKS